MVEEIETTFDDIFLAQQNHLVLQEIFMYLDPKSLTKAAQVNSRWNTYIHNHIWGRTSTRNVLQQRLDNRWERGSPLITTLQSGDAQIKIFDIKVDQENIYISLENGTIEKWDRNSLKKTHSIDGFYTHGVHMGLHPKYIICGFFNKKIDVWSKCTLEKVQTVELDSNVYIVKVSSNFAVISFVNGSLEVFKFLPNEKTPIKLHLRFEGSLRSAVRIDLHGDYMVSADGTRQLTLRNLEDGAIIKTTSFQEVNVSRVKYYPPHCACLTWSPNLDNDQIIIWNIDAMERVCLIDVPGMVDAFSMDSKRLVVHVGGKILHTSTASLNKQVKLEQISGISIGKHLESRECTLETDQMICPGSKTEPPGTFHVQNYWLGEINANELVKISANTYSPVFWLKKGLDTISFSINSAIKYISFLLWRK